MDSYSIYPKQFNNSKNQLQINTCFVIMPFCSALDNTYMVIDSVATSMGIKCTRADNISTTSEPILNKICTQISQAYYIVVDITNLNPNVFYELGIAHVLRDAKKVLIIKEKQTECPSDLKHLHYYEYKKSELKELKNIIDKFFSENNIHEDLLDVLDLIGVTNRYNPISQKFVVSLSDNMGDSINCLVMILNNKITDVSENNANNLLFQLTDLLNKLSLDDELYSLYSELILLLIEKLNSVINISDYLSKIFKDNAFSLLNEWVADCSIAVLDNTLYFNMAIYWIMQYLKQISPAEFDIAKYKLEIGIIKSKSEGVDEVLVNGLTDSNKTLVEHSAKLIKERKIQMAIPNLIDLVEKEESPYVVRSCIDAIVKTAPLDVLLMVKDILKRRQTYIDSHSFIKKHIEDLDLQISILQKTSND